MRRLEQRQAAGPGALQIPVHQGDGFSAVSPCRNSPHMGHTLVCTDRIHSAFWLAALTCQQIVNTMY